MPRRGLLVVVLGMAALVAVSAPLADAPGNSPNAKACQKDGWKSLYTRSGQPFSNGGDCTSYAAHGGQLIVKAALACLNNGWKSLGPNSTQPFTGEQACVDFANAGGTPVAAGSDLGLTKTVSNATPNVGETITFTVTLTNAGPAAATGVVVSDALPGELTFVSATPSQGTFTGGMWMVGTVTTGTPQTLTISARVDSPDSSTNSASISHADQPDPNAANNTASVTEHPQIADLSVQKFVGGSSTANVGEIVTFNVVLTNQGPDTATNVFVQDPVPAGFSFVSAIPSQGAYSGGLWTVGTVTTGVPQTLAIQAQLIDPDPDTNTASIVNADQFDPDTSDNSASAGVQVPADLGLTKAVNNATPNVGDDVIFTVTLSDNGPNAATGVTVSDLLPAGFTFVSATPSQGTYVASSGVWDVGSVAPGTPQTLQITATVDSPTPGTNTATITHADQLDANASNDTASVTVTPQVADLAVAKSVSPSSGFTYVSATPSKGSYTSSSGVWDIGTVTTTTPQMLSIQATVDTASTGKNTASISHSDQFDPDTSNNSASAGLS